MAVMYMIPGKTIIGHAEYRRKEKKGDTSITLGVEKFDIYYGNVIYGSDENRTLNSLPDNVYQKKLRHFLQGEGRMYQEPTPEDLEDAYEIAHGRPAKHGMNEFGIPGKRKEKPSIDSTQQLDLNPLEKAAAVQQTQPLQRSQPQQTKPQQPQNSQQVPQKQAEQNQAVQKSPVRQQVQQEKPKTVPQPQSVRSDVPVQPTATPSPVPQAAPVRETKAESATVSTQPVQTNPLENNQENNQNQTPSDKDLRRQQKELERQLEENKRKQAEEKRRQDAEQKRLQKAEARKAKEDARLAGKTEQSQLDNSDYGSVTMRHSKALMPVMTVLIALVVISIAGNVYLFKQLYAANAKPDTLDVVQVTGSVNAGDVLSEDSIAKVSITEEEYEKLSGKSVIKSDGTTEDEKPLLWDNREQAVGKYATENLKDGDTLLTSDYSAVTSDSSFISMDLNGQTVKVPVNVTTAGNSDIHLYAIITTTDDDGNTRNAAVDLGQFKLEGRTLSDILNSEGESKLEEYLGNTDTANGDK